MAIKRILLPICDDGDFKHLAQAAFQIGRMLSAQVRGLFMLTPYFPLTGGAALTAPISGPLTLRPHLLQTSGDELSAPVSAPLPLRPYFLPTSSEAFPPEMVHLLFEHDRRTRAERSKQAYTLFDGVQTRSPHVEAEFVAATGNICDVISHAARLADITVLGSGSQFSVKGWDEAREAALFSSGRPVLLVPPNGVQEGSFDRVIIGWKESIEAARAIAAADPFLMFAKEVNLITIGEDTETGASLQDVENYLQLHYSELRSEIVAPSEKEVGEILIEKCVAQGPTLLVMGAYSHWRWQERVFGGVTEHVLREARIPVLLSH